MEQNEVLPLKGDIDLDGYLTYNDVEIMERYIEYDDDIRDNITDLQIEIADMDEDDGDVDYDDVNLVELFLRGQMTYPSYQ